MRKKIVVAAPWSVVPTIDGRRSKALARYLQWSSVADVEVLCFADAIGETSVRDIRPGLREIQIARGSDIQNKMEQLFAPLADCGVFFRLNVAHTPAYSTALQVACQGASLVVACTPFTYFDIRSATALPVVVDSLGLETAAAEDYFDDDPRGREIRRCIALMEFESIRRSDGVVAAAPGDRTAFIGHGQLEDRVVLSVPLLWQSFDECPPRELRAKLKSGSNFVGKTVAVFAGSLTRGNVVTVKTILREADDSPNVYFLIVGGILEAFREQKPRPNVGFTGQVSDAMFLDAVRLSDFCIELSSRVQTSSKIQAYVRGGAPVVATRVAADAAGLQAGQYFEVIGDALSKSIAEVLGDPANADLRAAIAFGELRARHAKSEQDAACFGLVERIVPSFVSFGVGRLRDARPV